MKLITWRGYCLSMWPRRPIGVSRSAVLHTSARYTADKRSSGLVSNYELRTTNYELRTTNYELRTTNYELRTTNYEPRTTNYELRTTNYELRTTNYELRTTNYELRTTNYELRTTNYELRTTNYEPLVGGLSMRLVFMGTPDFAVASLRALVRGAHDVVGVFTQPDRPSGRGRKLKPSPVKIVAEELGLSVFQPEKIKTLEGIQQLQALAPDCIIVVAYGQILSTEILQLPCNGCINVHASLLPSYRGAAPIHWAVMKGETRTGVTTMWMDEGLDTGDMLLKREIVISDEATTGQIHDVLAYLGGELLLDTLQELEMGRLTATPQTDISNYASLLKREHERIDWSRGAVELHHQIRGLNPWPGAFAIFRGENLKIWRSTPFLYKEKYLETEGRKFEVRASSLEPRVKAAEPGQILQVLEDSLVVQTGDGVLRILEVQPAGKRAMPARDFFNGRHGQTGEKLE